MKTITATDVKRHAGRTDLIGEYKWGDAGQIFLFFIFLTIWITDSFILHYTTFLAEYIPTFILLLAGTLVLFFSWQLARSGLRIVFGQKREKPEVIRKGVFSMVRHPVYVGSILLYLGLILYTLSLASAAFWLVIVVFYYFISRYEEKILTDYFGEEYLRYKNEVPMLIPRLTGKKPE
ncbi:MAG: isoprenylcysteine carboxylmethyltransferase family protein [Bacteroidales bacterium]|nr:isoprenylcysteine carboxylmethyltransferase family protein [Bacteroidales bacterium]